ncbi:phosphoribosylanthranilate isomerase [Polymorphobacter sp. PAMC 29334]|uniref:phosphoribosylanthranilate isomerase n=1 Tax=Polymorphobacter sp. PAMC 29334 TaxID=2862331 RepID=UPI001C76A280|nr:phosphoribosylanthranilate isomerase [Polymorphobacter sp. PAMC 29334]QYE35304.1 phosphoribosylanthranilate isomerase [Polymorphobacter sp. PAMC 29334]
MTLDIKICGLSTPEAIDAAVGGGASHVGFVFFAASPRNVDPDRASALGQRVPSHVTRVGVFVDPDDALLDRTAAGLDAIQLHGRETPARVAEVRRRYGRPVWRGVGVASRDDIDAAVAAFGGTADRLLFDAKAPRGAALPGGNGLRFDWRLLDRVGRACWGLSGGLDAGSVAEAVRTAHPSLVDVSSGVEDEPGVKSVAKIKAFIAAARAA